MHARLAVIAAAVAGLVVLIAPAWGVKPAAERSAERGRDLALNVCSACHIVAKVQEFQPILNPPAASFAEIINRPGANAAAMRHFVATTHWDEKTVPPTMPSFSLTKEQIDDVVQYLMSLRQS
jgi:mono/diheme cytochrome c family protein